jgi:hypothetical protein
MDNAVHDREVSFIWRGQVPARDIGRGVSFGAAGDALAPVEPPM